MEYMKATIRADPTDIQFSEMKTDERSSFGETTVSILWSLLFFHNLMNYLFIV